MTKKIPGFKKWFRNEVDLDALEKPGFITEAQRHGDFVDMD